MQIIGAIDMLLFYPGTHDLFYVSFAKSYYGGYEDDMDLEDEIFYPGYDGRDLESGKQVAHQTFSANRSLFKIIEIGIPVRAIRSKNSNSMFATKMRY